MNSEIIAELKKIVGEKYVITPEMPVYHAYTFGDATLYRSRPEVVIYPGSVAEIQKIVQLAANHKIPVTTGAGLTGLSGGAITYKGILLILMRLRSVKSVDPLSKTVVAEPGITCAQLNNHLKNFGMVIPVAPASHLISSLGANIAESAGGTWGMSKGTFKNYLLSLKVIDGNGKIFSTGAPFPKQSTGPDLTALFLGSEGTMGVITEVTLRCEFLPEDTWTLRCSFKDEAVLQKIHEEVACERIQLFSFEYMDGRMMSCIHGGQQNMLLLLQTAGSQHAAREQMEKLVTILEKLEPLELVYTNDPAKADQLYTERRSALGALAKADRTKPVIIQFDPVLPLQKFAAGTQKMRELAAREQLDLIIYGHAGDGNLHPSFIVRDNLEDKMKARKVIREFDTWIEKEGGCYSGEHAIGFFLGRSQNELRPAVAPYLEVIKSAFDPHGILNPGKVINIQEGPMTVDAVKPEYQEISNICSLCVKCHLCKNDSPKYTEEPFEHNTIRGRIALIDAATRGKVKFSEIKSFIQEMEPWTLKMNCPAYIKNEMGKLIELSVKAGEAAA
ncbi:FAD-binding oxidoreductase [candidate division KSB1 bacterium]|nr:FAD-binding oxidoreductase [candidate division KSB1 bacterium]